MGAKKGDAPSKKTEKKKQEKIIEDKTFGLKNKNKSKVVQKYIKGVEQTVKGAAKGGLQAEKNKEFQMKAEKKKQKEEEAFLNSLVKSVHNIKQKELDEGEVARNVLCAYFKEGCCPNGDKCEFSHDLNIEFNQGTFDIYTDLRDAKKNLNTEINSIAEEKEKKRSKLPQSNIVCKYFLDALQRKIYGWKWDCPNGDVCQYKHCLPKGYVMNQGTKEKDQEEMTIEDFYNLEEQIDEERDRIAKSGTPVNEKTFLEWKKKRDEFRKNGQLETKTKKKVQTGLQLFRNQANLFKDDENAQDIERDENQQSEDEENDEGKHSENKELNGVKVNSELFQDDNLDELDDLDDDEPKEEEKDEETTQDI